MSSWKEEAAQQKSSKEEDPKKGRILKPLTEKKKGAVHPQFSKNPLKREEADK